MIVDGRLNRHELDLAASCLYQLCHEFGGGEANRISYDAWAARFVKEKKNHVAARRQWERLKYALKVLGAPVLPDRDGRKVDLVLRPGAREFALRILDGLTKYARREGEDAMIDGTRFLLVDLDDVEPPDGEPDPGEVEDMKESIRTCSIGLIHPVVLVGEAPPFRLGVGRTRYAACKALGMTRILARLVKTWDPLLAVEEDRVRKHYGAADLAHLRQERDRIIAERKAAGESNRLIAQALGTSEATVRRWPGATGVAPGHPDTVTGSDGKAYPARPTEERALEERRERVRALYADGDGLSKRAIARAEGVSRATIDADLLAVDEAVEPAPPKPVWSDLDPSREPPWLCVAAMEEGLYRALEEPRGADLRPYLVDLERIFAGIASRIRKADFVHEPPPLTLESA